MSVIISDKKAKVLDDTTFQHDDDDMNRMTYMSPYMFTQWKLHLKGTLHRK